MSKPTLATVKKFIKESGENLLIKKKSEFDGMSDGTVTIRDAQFTKALKSEHCEEQFGKDHKLGVHGAWFVFGSRDHITEFETATHKGFDVFNCCGSFTLATSK